MYTPKYTKIHGKTSVRSHAERIIKKFVLILALFSFSACGQKDAENTDLAENVSIIGKAEETPPQEAVESEKVAAMGDEVLKTMKITIQDIEYTLEAVGKKEEVGR